MAEVFIWFFENIMYLQCFQVDLFVVFGIKCFIKVGQFKRGIEIVIEREKWVEFIGFWFKYMDGIVVGKVDIFIIVFGNFVGVVVNVVVIFIVVFEVMGKELFCLYDLYSIKI